MDSFQRTSHLKTLETSYTQQHLQVEVRHISKAVLSQLNASQY